MKLKPWHFLLLAAAVILIAPISGLDPGLTSLLITPALAAALLGSAAARRCFWPDV